MRDADEILGIHPVTGALTMPQTKLAQDDPKIVIQNMSTPDLQAMLERKTEWAAQYAKEGKHQLACDCSYAVTIITRELANRAGVAPAQ